MFSYSYLESIWREFPWSLLHLGGLLTCKAFCIKQEIPCVMQLQKSSFLYRISKLLVRLAAYTFAKKINWKSSELWKSVIDMGDSRAPCKRSSLLESYVVMAKIILNCSFGEETNSCKHQSHFFGPFQKDKLKCDFTSLKWMKWKTLFPYTICQWKIQTYFVLVRSVLFVPLTIAFVKVFDLFFFYWPCFSNNCFSRSWCCWWLFQT